LLGQLGLVLLGQFFGLSILRPSRFQIGIGFLKAKPGQPIIQAEKDRTGLDCLGLAHFELDHPAWNEGIKRSDAVFPVHIAEADDGLNRRRRTAR
jgi:hypothetical protein